MPRPLLPPRGVFVPSQLVYDPDLSASVFRTWVQLRGLAWGSIDTPRMSIQRLAEITAKSTSTIYGHMALLRSRGALRWRSSDQGTLIVNFESVEEKAPVVIPDSRNLEKPALNPPEDSQELFKGGREAPFQDSGILDSGAAAVYRSLTRIKPNQAQRRMLTSQVHDAALWYATVEHWLAHRWNPRNIPGMLDLYQRGGAPSCKFCSENPGQEQVNLIERVRKEIENGLTP